MPTSLRRLLSVLALSAVVVAWSEILYYPTDGPVWLLIPWYAPAVVVALDLVLAVPCVRLRHVVLAGWGVGAIVEGAVVGVLYLEAPVSTVNPVLGWHMAVTTVVGVAAVHVVVRDRRWWVAPALTMAAGAGLGGWWTLWLVDDPLTVAEVGVPLALGALIAALGHLFVLRWPLGRPARWAVVASWCVIALGVVAQTASVPWAPLVLLPVLGAPAALLRRAGRQDRRVTRGALDHLESVPAASPPRSRPWRLAWLALIPLAGTATFAAITTGLDPAVAADVIGSMLWLAQSVAGIGLAAWAVITSYRRDRSRTSAASS